MWRVPHVQLMHRNGFGHFFNRDLAFPAFENVTRVPSGLDEPHGTVATGTEHQFIGV